MGKKPGGMLQAGDAAPPFELKTLEGGKASLAAILEKGPAILAFFKISCPVCQMVAPFLERLASAGSVPVYGISQDDAASTEAFNRRFGVTFPVLIDEGRSGYPASNGFGIGSVPSVFVVEPGGLVDASFTGFSKRDLEALGRRLGIETFRPDEKVPEFRAG